MRSAKWWAAALCCAAWCQTPPADSGTVIRTESRTVPVDVVATDKKGAYVRDLDRKDFRVFEDGHEQPVAGFSYASDAASPWRAERQYIAVVFDNSTVSLTDQMTVRPAMVKWVEANAGAATAIAVFDFRVGLAVTQNFTANLDLLVKAVQKGQAAPVPQGGAGGSLMQAAQGATDGSAMGLLGRQNMLPIALRDLAKNLANVPGRKILLVVSGGFTSSTDDMANLIRTCNRANVAVYPVEPSGMHGNDKMGPATVLRAGLSENEQIQQSVASSAGGGSKAALMELAAKTGGFYSESGNTPDVTFARVAAERAEFYLLGYAPPDSPQGSCHAIRVEVARPGVSVRARNSYCNSAIQDQLAGTEAGADLDRRADAAVTAPTTAALALPYFYTAANTARVSAVMDIPYSELEFKKQKGKLEATVDILGVAYSENNKVVARFSDSVAVAARDVAEVGANHLHYENQFGIAPGQYRFRLVFASGRKKLGKLMTNLSVDPYDGKQFTLSAVALSNEARKAEGDVESSLLEGRTPLVADGVQLVPSATNRFRFGDRANLYVEVYGSSAARLGLRSRIVDRSTGAERFDSGWMEWKSAAAGGPVAPIALKLWRNPLTHGSYRLEIQAANAAGATTKVRTADFDVE